MIEDGTLYERLEDALIGHYRFEEHERIEKDQIMLLKILIIISGLLIGIMAVIRLLNAHLDQASVDLAFVFILSGSFYLLHQHRRYFKAISRFIIGSALMTVAMLIHTIPDSFAPLFWVATTIYLMFFLLNKKEAWKWLATVMSYLAVIYYTGHGLQSLSPSDMFIFFGNVSLLSLVLTWYERIKEDNARHILQKNVRLEEEVADKTKELRETNSSLQQLNETLGQRIDEEIAKSREKDKIMLAQSRQAAMGDMISMIAHQWRQPISVISMGANNILLDIELGQYEHERVKEKLDKIIAQTHYLSQTIDDFRDFLRPTKQPKSTTLEAIAEGALSIIGQSLEDNGITLVKRFGDDVTLSTFPNELIQVLLNIINNSKDVFKERRDGEAHIWLYTDHDSTMAVMKVCDDAGGIPPEILPRIFEPYFSTKESKGGTGLGLYMSQMIVERHLGGSLTAENRDDGACLTITLPIKKEV